MLKIKQTNKEPFVMVGEMACGLRVQTAEAKDPQFDPPHPHQVAHKLQGDPVPLASVNIELICVHTCMHAYN